MSKRIRLSIPLLAVSFLLAIGFVAAPASANESQQFVVSIDNVRTFPFSSVHVFNTPIGENSAGPARPGDAYEFSFYAAPGERVSFATMLVESNDYFFAPDELGIPVYNASGEPNAGDVTRYVNLWDAGTEGDELLGSGPYQAPRQPELDMGPHDPNSDVRQVLRDDIPSIEEMVQVTLSSAGPQQFVLRIENVSGDSSLPSPLAPGVGVVHTAVAPLFISGQPDAGNGLEGLAEDGTPGALARSLRNHAGITTPLAPVAWAVHTSPDDLFESGTTASSGLETLAEDGGPMALVESLTVDNKGAAAIPHGAGSPGPITPPDGNYRFMITADPGDHLSLATMFVQSNDWFYALRNIPLFDEDGEPLSGNLTHLARLYDAGTEVDQAAGYGSDQAPRQAGPNTGATEGGIITAVDNLPTTVLHITITPVD